MDNYSFEDCLWIVRMGCQRRWISLWVVGKSYPQLWRALGILVIVRLTRTSGSWPDKSPRGFPQLDGASRLGKHAMALDAVRDNGRRSPTTDENLESVLMGGLEERPIGIVEHIGSTAVPGLATKPIIDIDVTAADVVDEGTTCRVWNPQGLPCVFVNRSIPDVQNLRE